MIAGIISKQEPPFGVAFVVSAVNSLQTASLDEIPTHSSQHTA